MSFLEDFKAEHEAAGAIVLSRDKEGRNKAVSVVEQFTVGDRAPADFVMDIIEMKLKRARSYAEAGNYFKFREEMHDVSNYGLFCVVFEKPSPIPAGGLAQPIRDAAKAPPPPLERD